MNLTKEAILAMEPGKELEALVGKIFGFEPDIEWQILNPKETASAFSADSKREAEDYLADTLKRFPNSRLKDYHVGCWELYPLFSTKIDAAWLVVERLGVTWDMHLMRHFTGGCTCAFDRTGNYNDTIAKAGTAPEAICKAALLVKLSEGGLKNEPGSANSQSPRRG